jgi:hypothetical protein
MTTQLDYASPTGVTRPSNAARITGWVLTLLPTPLLLMGVVMMLTHSPKVIEGFTKAGYPESAITLIGVLELVSIVLYLIPQTAVLGALLLTGYLGGAVNHHIRISEYPQAVFPVLFAVVLWLALLLRDPRLRPLLPLRRV